MGSHFKCPPQPLMQSCWGAMRVRASAWRTALALRADAQQSPACAKSLHNLPRVD
jgi:hypothetical protein